MTKGAAKPPVKARVSRKVPRPVSDPLAMTARLKISKPFPVIHQIGRVSSEGPVRCSEYSSAFGAG